jgi:hypothetical protein
MSRGRLSSKLSKIIIQEEESSFGFILGRR